MAKGSGRVMSDQTCNLKAEEILDVMKAWDIGQADAYYIIRQMKHMTATATEWVNPLKRIGMHVKKAGEG